MATKTKTKIGRPRTRDARIGARYFKMNTLEEDQRLEQVVAKAGTTICDFARAAVLERISRSSRGAIRSAQGRSRAARRG